MSPRRVLFWVLMVLYGAVSIAWLVIVPHRPAELLRAIPGQATIVSFHDNLAGRWDELAMHPVAMMAVGAAGGDAGEWELLCDDPVFRYIIDLAGQRETVLAYVPYMDGGAAPAWVMASWIGGRSQRLRWSEPFLDLPGLERMGAIGNWPVWKYSWQTDAGEQTITLALVEGMLLATSARDVHSVGMVIDAYNGIFPSIARRPDLQTLNDRLLHSRQPHRAFVRWRSGTYHPSHWFLALDLAGEGGLHATLQTAASELPSTLPAKLDTSGLDALWGNQPVATAIFSADALLQQISEQEHPVAFLTRDVVMQSGAESIVLGLLSSKYLGKLKVISVPTLMAGLHRSDDLDVESFMRATVDRWNARHRMGLVPVEHNVAGRRVWRLEGTAGGFYGLLAPGEQAAVTAAGDWLLISSNFGALEALIRDQVGAASSPLAWTQEMNDLARGGGLGYLGFDLASGAEVFQISLRAYAGKLAFEDFRGTRELRQKLNEARAWVDMLAQLERLQVFASADKERLTIDIKTGP
jgi:hypothetical protein